MKKTIVMTDSNSGLLQSEASKLGIFIVPMPFTINEVEYLEDISISQEEFYKYLEAGADVKTAQPSPFYLQETWDTLLKEYDEIIYIPMSSGLSGTCESAMQFAKEYGGRVVVVDNLRISCTQKESVFEALAMLELGKTAAEIKKYLEETGKRASIYIMMTVLKYLKKGGRISPTAAAIGSLLKVKPILTTRGGKLEKFAMALSVAQGKKKIIDKIKEEIKTEFKADYDRGGLVVSVAHTQSYEEAMLFMEQLKSELPKANFRFIDPLSLSVACHIGGGSLAVAVTINNYLKL